MPKRARTANKKKPYKRHPDTGKLYGRKWREHKERHLAIHPLCEECLKEGITKAAELCHHDYIGNYMKPELFYNVPLVSLCHKHHQEIHHGK